MTSFAAFGNDLYTGRRSYDIIGRRRLWYAVSAAMVLLSVVLLLTRGLNPGIEFRGGTDFRVTGAAAAPTSRGEDAVASVVPDGEEPRVSTVGTDSVRVQTERLSTEETEEVTLALAEAYEVSPSAVTASFVGPTWGDDVTRQALIALAVFLALAALVLAAYFRTWRMAAAAMIALVHDVVITAGLYSLTGLEVTPSTVVGFLTILGYSLYDTVVVFDKIRENTAHVLTGSRLTFAEAVNLAVNQTLVRSINTTVVALLPVAAILFVGVLLLGAGTLTDIAVALFIGMLTGAYSSIFLAPPLYAHLVGRVPAVAEHTARVLQGRAGGGAGGAGGAVPGPGATTSRTTAVSGSLLGSRAGAAVLDRPDAGPPGRPGGDPGGDPDGDPGGAGASPDEDGRRAVTGADAARQVRRDGAARATRGPRNQPVRRPGARRR